jgi:bifunctional DNA-binding transcriptional regulator/antitoxin component of YhaV-PrlF toxin-antitoxin module
MTEITVRQRNQITIPKAIAEEAGIAEGAVGDLSYANGVITISFRAHPREPFDVSQYIGIGKGLWGDSVEEIDRTLREQRDTADRF